MICRRCGGSLNESELMGDSRDPKTHVHMYTDDCFIKLKQDIAELREMMNDKDKS